MHYSLGSQDPFTVHFEQDLSETTEKQLSDLRTWKQTTRKVSSVYTDISVISCFNQEMAFKETFGFQLGDLILIYYLIFSLRSYKIRQKSSN